MHLRHPLVVPLAIALAVGAGPLLAQEQADQQDPRTEVGDGQAAVDASRVPLDEIRRYVAVYGAVKQAYVEPVEDRELMQSAIRGLLLDLDPHSAYLEGDAAAAVQLARAAARVGVRLVLGRLVDLARGAPPHRPDRKSTRQNTSHRC